MRAIKVDGLANAVTADAWQVRVNGVGTIEGRVLALVQGAPRTVNGLVVILGAEWWEVVRAVLKLYGEGEIFTRHSWGDDAVWERCA